MKVSNLGEASITDVLDYVPIPLPSNFEPYHFKSINLKRVNAKAQMRFIYAHREDMTRSMVDVVNALIHPIDGVEGNIALQLAIEDFNYVCHWLYTNSYLPRPFQSTQICDNADHIKRIEAGELDPSTVVQALKLDPATVEVTTRYFDVANYETFTPHGSVVRDALRFPTMEDACWFEEATKKIESYVEILRDGERTPEPLPPLLVNFLPTEFGGSPDTLALDEFVNLLCLLKVPENIVGADPWEWRMAWLEDATIQEADALRTWQSIVFDTYGVTLSTTYTCKECGAVHRISPKIMPRNFF
jgi:hypothetical protein